jgi:hypothetical protein
MKDVVELNANLVEILLRREEEVVSQRRDWYCYPTKASNSMLVLDPGRKYRRKHYSTFVDLDVRRLGVRTQPQ